jgi:ATP-binding cassette subfamily C (CFTR/MRP) protein 1
MQEQQMKNRDKRTRLMSELLNNIKRFVVQSMRKEAISDIMDSIKLYAWEYSFIRRILEIRNNQELRTLKKIGILTVSSKLVLQSILGFLTNRQSCNMALWTGIPLFVAFGSFATAAITSSRPLTADLIFPAISLFMLLQFPLAMVPSNEFLSFTII